MNGADTVIPFSSNTEVTKDVSIKADFTGNKSTSNSAHIEVYMNDVSIISVNTANSIYSSLSLSAILQTNNIFPAGNLPVNIKIAKTSTIVCKITRPGYSSMSEWWTFTCTITINGSTKYNGSFTVSNGSGYGSHVVSDILTVPMTFALNEY